MYTLTLLFLIASCQFLLSVQGLTLRLKGKEIIPKDGAVNINDLPVGGCRRYDTLECLSDVPYQGRVEKAYWKYTDPYTLVEYVVDDIRCKTTGRCKNPEIGWQSTKGIYKNGNSYFGVVRLGRTEENITVQDSAVFTCHFEGDSNSPVSVNIIAESATDGRCAPTGLKINEKHDDDDNCTISWDEPSCDVDSYTLYYTDKGGRTECQDEPIDGDMTSYTLDNGLDELQLAAHQNNKTECSKVYEIIEGTLTQKEKFEYNCGCAPARDEG